MLFTGLGVCTLRRRKPMWFRSGSSVKEEELTDVRACNRANGIMWIAFSAVFRVSTVPGFLRMQAGGVCLLAGSVCGVPVLPAVYSKIYKKYKKRLFTAREPR